MHDFIMAEDSELWDVICDGPYVPTKKVGDPPVTMPKTRKEYNDADRKAVEKIFRAKKILVCGIGPDKYNRISACQSAKEIWEALETTHEGTTQELHSLGEIIPRNKLVRKILSVLPSSWESKVNAITEAKDLQELTIDELVGNLKTYEMKKKKDRHFIKDCPLLKQEHFKYNPDKAAKRNPVPDKRFKRKDDAANVVKQALAAWGDSSSESEEETDIDDKDALTIELGDAEQTRDDLVVCVVDLKETISYMENEKVASTEKNVSIEHERDDLMVLVVDVKETIENLSKEKNYLVEKIDALEQERDDLLVVIIDLSETIEELKAEYGSGRTDKGKGVASEAHIRLENELNAVKISLCAELEKTR
ncbi:PREDICTED: uncharacterized protein LOC109224234 [Nicotiana attenuata]|uniref:uncharacterized protein LOC109224234 n=1 Tax=Nicotiana attenuata TaxID=49451 RepID=UPI000905A0A4|nr:PREDICTED: uncharacterized protein LOC109224234 [Nicotiana attenuata]